jgi:hypothetical protein
MEGQPRRDQTTPGNGKVTDLKSQRQFHSLSELAGVTGKDYRSIHRAVQAGKIKTVNFGASRMIPKHEYERVLAHGWRWERGRQRQQASGGPKGEPSQTLPAPATAGTARNREAKR